MALMRTGSLLAFSLLAGTACSDRVVDSRAYNDEGRLAWSTVMPSSKNTALWLRYSVNGDVSRNSPEDEGVISYQLQGHLAFLVNGGGKYTGSVYLRPQGVAIDKVYSKGERDDVTRSCGYSSCLERGRLKLMSLHEVPAGAVLEFESWLPLDYGGASLNSASLELAPN